MGNYVSCWSGFGYRRLRQPHNQMIRSYNPLVTLTGPVNEERLRIPVSQKGVSLVANHIGIGFESIGIELGLNLVVIEQGKVSHPHSLYMQTLHMLTKWKERNGRSATGLVLVRALWRCRGRCTLEMDAILNILKSPST
ncbi:death domain-containing protein CRADD-like [Haliotis cracherodii]|uniref:death domain-containing protein CRADD-like n=1 Tax=Haliotis cracherodii TaxID=6455 RepID=UPI0039E85994